MPSYETEAELTRRIVKALRDADAWAVKIHGGPMQSRGLPDIVGVYRGRGFGLEVKRPGKRNTLTPLQAKTLRDIRDAGGIGFLVTSVDEALAALGIDA